MKKRDLQLYLFAWLAYITLSMLGFPFLRASVMLFSLPLAMLGGWFYTYPGALVTTILIIPYQHLLLNFHTDDPAILREAMNPFGIGSLLAFSLGAALLRTIDQHYQKLNNELEHIVEERTNDLRSLTDYLINMDFLDRGITTSGLLDYPVKLLRSMKETSKLLYTSMEETEHLAANSAKVVYKYTQQCMEKLSEFLIETKYGSRPDTTLHENVEKMSERMIRLGLGKLNIALEGEWDHFDADVTHQLYSIISEAVVNAIRHANPMEITVTYQHDSQNITICVENDGGTFPTRLQEGMGLPLMRYRAMSIGGSLKILGGPGQRTRVICTIPHTATAEKSFPNGVARG